MSSEVKLVMFSEETEGKLYFPNLLGNNANGIVLWKCVLAALSNSFDSCCKDDRGGNK
jgi:hypothetical protein